MENKNLRITFSEKINCQENDVSSSDESLEIIEKGNEKSKDKLDLNKIGEMSFATDKFSVAKFEGY